MIQAQMEGRQKCTEIYECYDVIKLLNIIKMIYLAIRYRNKNFLVDIVRKKSGFTLYHKKKMICEKLL